VGPVPVKWWLAGSLLLSAAVFVPSLVHWLRHRPHRLTQGTQHILWAGHVAQIVLVLAAGFVVWLD
jgi:hypothetical protein